jgi:orotidine-5'-phosphate decarboxylase
MKRLFCSLDWVELDDVVARAGLLKDAVGGFKIGAEFVLTNGLDGVRALKALGKPVMLDLKLNDIPKAIANAVRQAALAQPFLITVHASGGAAMMRAAMAAAHRAADTSGQRRPLVLAVTVLTSIDEGDLSALGVADRMAEQVLRLAALAQACGLDGAWTSAAELPQLRRAFGPDFLLVVPGIRPVWSSSDDQKRIVTPADAVRGGADFLVVGRPITQARDPAEAARQIADEINRVAPPTAAALKAVA